MNSDHVAVNHVAKDGFVDLNTADALRQSRAVEGFKEKHRDLYDRAVAAKVSMLTAAKTVESMRGEVIKAADQKLVADILKSIDTEALAAVKTVASKVEAGGRLIAIEGAKDAPEAKTASKDAPVIYGGKELSAPRRKS